MLDELTLILISIAVIAVCVGSLYFVEWFGKKDSGGWNG